MQLRIKQQGNVRHAPWKGTIGQFDWTWLWSLGLLGALGLLGLGTAQAQVAPVCNIQLNKTTYVNGDTVIAQVLQIANPTTVEVPVELKIWVDIAPPPSPALLIRPASIVNIGWDGSVKLPPGFTVGPVELLRATVTAAFPRGTYRFNCRMLHPVTKEFFTEDLHPFAIQ